MSQPEQPEGQDDSTHNATDENELCALVRRGVRNLWLSYASIQRAVRNSCKVCMVFDKAILAVVDGCLPELFRGPQDETERTMILDTLVVVSLWCVRRDGRSHTKGSTEILEMKMEINGRMVCIEIFRDEDEQPEFMLGDFTFPPKPRYGPTTCSDRAFERARGWLRNCLEHHDCKALATKWAPNQSRPPRRLLELRAETIRLFDTDNAQSHLDAPYVCLSHRWGDSRHRRLTSTVHTIQKHLQEIPWDDLPRTFQDAVTICRRMDIKYLWIDSLCILQEFDGIQDDEASLRETRTDFARENSFMATTYQNSLFTISANISTNMDSGIFCRRAFPSKRIRIIDREGVSAYFRIREATGHDLKPTDLETRGWTLQECILPTRILLFGAFDVSWRCQQFHLCECEKLNIGVNDSYPWSLHRISALPTPGDENVLLWWRDMVGLYSSRKLTNEQDKLPALSGLAQLCHAGTGHTYSAGLWKEILHEDLCWYHSDNMERFPMLFGIGRRPRQFRSPSWSWASLDACGGQDHCYWWYERGPRRKTTLLQDDYNHTLLKNVCTIFEVTCKPRTSDAFGEVDPGAFIEIGTGLISATIATAPDVGYIGRREVLPWIVSFDEDDPDRDVDLCVPDCRLEDDGLMIGDAVYCAPILEQLSTRRSRVGCLILKCVGGQRYRRVGFCVLCKFNPVPRWGEQYDKPLDAAMIENTGSNEGYAFRCSKETEVRIVIV